MIDDLDILRAANLLLKRYGQTPPFKPRGVPMSYSPMAIATVALYGNAFLQP